MRHQELLYNVTGQSFIYDPPEGRPSGTPTVEVFAAGVDDDGTAETATTGSCSVDSVDTTLDGAVSAGSTSLTLASGSGIVRGRRYLLTDATTAVREWVEVLAVNGTAVIVRQPLINDFATASTFEGCRISISVNSTWVADDSKITDVLAANVNTNTTSAPGAAGYRLRWSYTVDSVATIGVSYADLVRYQSKNLVNALDVDRTFPGWIDRLATDYREDQGAALVDEAFRAVKMDALADAQLLRRIRDTEVLSELVKYRANVLAVQNNVLRGSADTTALEVARGLYTERYNALIREPKVAVDQSGDGSSGDAVRLPVWRR